MTKIKKAINPVTDLDFESLLKGVNLSYTSTVKDVYNYIEGLDKKAKEKVIVPKVNGHDRNIKTLQEETDELRAMSTDWKADLINWIGGLEQLFLNGERGTISGIISSAYNCINNPMLKLHYPTIFSFKDDFYKVYQNKKPSLPINIYFIAFLNMIHKGVELALILPELRQELQELEEGKVKTPKEPAYTSLKEIFVSEDAYNEAIRALQEVNTPVIDKNLNYLLGERQKSAITAWFEVLETKGKIKTISAPEKARLLNDTIRGLNISEKTTQIPENKIERASSHKKYFPRFNFLISQN